MNRTYRLYLQMSVLLLACSCTGPYGKTSLAPYTQTPSSPTNHAPVAQAQSVSVDRDTAQSITLSGTDADGDPLTYTVVTAPAHGTLTGTPPNLTYTPTTSYVGADSFTFTVNDGTVDSASASVSLGVTIPSGTLLSSQKTSGGYDNGLATAVDSSGNVWITGWTAGTMPGSTHIGGTDGFIAKFDSSGALLFAKNFGTTGSDTPSSLAIDSNDNVWITGTTDDDFGNGNVGGYDGFLVEFDASGNQLLAENFGTSDYDFATAIAIDSNDGIWLTGYTLGDFGGGRIGDWDGFLMKVDSSANVLISKNIGGASTDWFNSIAVDSNDDVWVAGQATASGGSFNHISLRKFDASGAALTSQTVGSTNEDLGGYITVDANDNVWVTGKTSGDFGNGYSGGSRDAFVAKLDSAGTILFMQNIGTSAQDEGYGVAVDADGNGWVVGLTQGDLGGGFVGGSQDAFAVKIDGGTGSVLASKNIGTQGDDNANGAVIDAGGTFWIVGSTNGNFGSSGTGSTAAFLISVEN